MNNINFKDLVLITLFLKYLEDDCQLINLSLEEFTIFTESLYYLRTIRLKPEIIITTIYNDLGWDFDNIERIIEEYSNWFIED